ncbi:MAG TPA: glycosyltransferase [Nitrososphaeraceae archaeon]|jgi:glycosyltransferase involved in cell wall biosynthesis
MADIIVIRSNSIIYNPRVGKIARSLKKRYSILVLGWNRESLPKKIINSYATDLSLFNLRAPFGKTILIAYMPLFWIWIFIKLISDRPNAIHACDLDTILPCYIYKILFRKRLVFDVCDRYAMAYVPPKFKRIYSLVNWVEENFGKKVDVLVNVSEELFRTFHITPKRSAIIMNCAEDYIEVPASAGEDANNKVKSKVLRLIFTGGIRRKRGLEVLVSALKDLSNVELVVLGRSVDSELHCQILEQANIIYKGLLKPAEVLTLESQSDVVISLYDLKDPISNFSMGNKIFEAMMLGLPMITNVATELVNEHKCGITVDYNNEKQIREIIVSLRDNVEFRKTLGRNGRQAFLKKYNWQVMEQELYKIYDPLVSKT